jgi:hypothetical protein
MENPETTNKEAGGVDPASSCSRPSDVEAWANCSADVEMMAEWATSLENRIDLPTPYLEAALAWFMSYGRSRIKAGPRAKNPKLDPSENVTVEAPPSGGGSQSQEGGSE